MLTIESRMRAAVKKHRGSKEVVPYLSAKLSEAQEKKRSAEQKIRWCEGFLEFQQRDVINEYQGNLKLFQIDDGEMHTVAASSEDHALQFYAVEFSGYESVDAYKKDMLDISVVERCGDLAISVYDIEGTEKVIVKTAAEWANVDKPYLVSTTVY